jgi:hypothetical protein
VEDGGLRRRALHGERRAGDNDDQADATEAEVLELYKTRPPLGKESQDVSFITSVVYSF